LIVVCIRNNLILFFALKEPLDRNAGNWRVICLGYLNTERRTLYFSVVTSLTIRIDVYSERVGASLSSYRLILVGHARNQSLRQLAVPSYEKD